MGNTEFETEYPNSSDSMLLLLQVREEWSENELMDWSKCGLLANFPQLGGDLRKEKQPCKCLCVCACVCYLCFYFVAFVRFSLFLNYMTF